MIFIATNRKYTGRTGWEEKFSNDFSNDPVNLSLACKDGDYFRMYQGTTANDPVPGVVSGGSEDFFRDIQAEMKGLQKPLLFFIHGFNNSFKDAVEAAEDIERIYDCAVLLFTWPSDGLLRYRDCKQRAVMSVPALDRLAEKAKQWLSGVTMETGCGQTINLMAHSMGNYMLKQFVNSSFYNNDLLFVDNVSLVAADINHDNHISFVERIKVRRDINIIINQRDIALDISDNKVGSLQKVRLGNYGKPPYSDKAFYLDITTEDGVGKKHGYFKDQDLFERNPALKKRIKQLLLA